MTPQQMVVNQDNAHAVFNENMATGQHQYVFGIDPNETGGLVVGYYGSDTDSDDVILWGGFTVTAGTFTLADDSDSYYVVERATGTPSCATWPTNWDNEGSYARVYKFTTVDGAVTVIEDHRAGPGGVHYGDGVSAGGGLLAANNLSDVANAATARTNLGVDTAIAAAISALIGGAPGALDTLNELADALADDAAFATTVTNALALKAPLASPALTGTPTVPTAAPGTNTTQAASTAFVVAAVTGLSVADGDKGDITVSGSGATWTIDNAAVTLAKIANAGASSKLLGSGASGSGAAYAELTLGTNLSITGTTLNATGGGSGGTKTYAVLTPLNSFPPLTNFATLDTLANGLPVLDFDGGTTNEAARWLCVMPEAASLGSGLKFTIKFTTTSATSGNVRWGAQVMRLNADVSVDSFDTSIEGHVAVSGDIDDPASITLTLTTTDSIAAQEAFIVEIYRDASDTTNDTAAGDAELHTVEVWSAA